MNHGTHFKNFGVYANPLFQKIQLMCLDAQPAAFSPGAQWSTSSGGRASLSRADKVVFLALCKMQNTQMLVF